jgi:catalase
MGDRNDRDVPVTTTDAGVPAASDEYSLTVGPDGPILLQDRYLIQKMAQFNRERVPERVVHAKGSGAFGYFEATEGAGQWTKADFLYRGVLDEAAKARLAYNITEHLKAGVEPRILRAAVDYWKQVDTDLGARIATGVGVWKPIVESSGRS